MTTYAYDPDTRQLVAVWDTGIGATARKIVRLKGATDTTAGLQLAAALTRMSTSVWMSYSDPDLIDLPVAAARRALRHPHLPWAGRVEVETHPVVQSAHVVGRELREVGSAGIAQAVIADVEHELEAAGHAELGDLSGRAQQAVTLTRVTPSPAQIAVADQLMHDVPTGNPRLYTEVEASAAGVAAIHWFLAAVTVVARLAGTSEAGALDEAETVQSFDSAVPRAVLRIATADPARTPLIIGRTLLQAAVLQSRGMILGARDAEPTEPYFTVLDPSQPARCLLERLVWGVQALVELYATHLDPELDPECDEVEWMDLARRHFGVAVREEAAARAPERMTELVTR